jgi:hypothetical protein
MQTFNLTTGFALPLLGWKKSMFQPYLVNAYIRHKGLEQFDKDKHLFVLLKWADEEKFKKIQETLENSKFYECTYEPDPNGEFVMFVMAIPEQFEKDYDMFLKGKYSKMSAKAKQLISISAMPGGSIVKILDRSTELKYKMEEKVGQYLPKDAEVWSSIEDEKYKDQQIFDEEKLADFYK